MGFVLLVVGVFGFVAATVVSKRNPAPAEGAVSGESPQPGEVPWIPAAKIGSLVVAIIGLLVIIF